MTDAGGVAVERTSYRPYGEEVAVQQPLTLPETKGFIGERLDDGSGLQYLNARYYDPRLGMFVQPDWWEVTEPGVGTNRYSYSGGDPVNRLDPSGHSWLGDAVRDIGRSIRNSFGALGDAVSGNVEHINNSGQYSGGNYGVVRVDGQTVGCFGCAGTGDQARETAGVAAFYSGYVGRSLSFGELNNSIPKDPLHDYITMMAEAGVWARNFSDKLASLHPGPFSDRRTYATLVGFTPGAGWVLVAKNGVPGSTYLNGAQLTALKELEFQYASSKS